MYKNVHGQGALVLDMTNNSNWDLMNSYVGYHIIEYKLTRDIYINYNLQRYKTK